MNYFKFEKTDKIKVWGYVNLMLGVGFVGGPPIGAWFTTNVARKYQLKILE